MNREQLFKIVDMFVQAGSALLETERANQAAAAATAATTAAVDRKVNCSLCGQPCGELRYEGACGQICEYCLHLGACRMLWIQSRLREHEDSLDRLRAASGAAARLLQDDRPLADARASSGPAAKGAPGRDIEREITIDFLQSLSGCVVPVTVDTGSGTRTLDVKVRPGTMNGRKLRLRGQGGPGEPPGDVLVTVRVEQPRVDPTRAEQMRDTSIRLTHMESQIAGMPRKGSA